jgi:hypothetical protein
MRPTYFNSAFIRTAAIVLTLVLSASANAANKKGKDENSPPDAAPNASFSTPMDKVQVAAVNALVTLGCEIKKQLPNYVEGKRTRKVGVFVGSGGETLRIWLTEANGKTSVKVSTEKTFVGGAGQKNWDKEVVDELVKGIAG